jgi:putative tricarboxylic transport membrane protein
MRKRDLYSGLFFFLIGVLSIIGSLSYSIWDRYGPGPGLFPLLLGIILSILSFLLFSVTSLEKEKENKEDELKESDSLNFLFIYKTMIYLCFLFGFYFLFDRLGFLLTIFFFMIGVLIFFSKRSMKLSLSVSLVTSIMTYIIFVRLLGVVLPGGILQNVFRFY